MDTNFVIAIVDDKGDQELGYLSGYRKGGYYHPGSVVQGTYDITDFTRTYDTEEKARRAMAQYANYSEVFMYEPTSTDYPMPSEKWIRKEVPTHLEVAEYTTPVDIEEVEGCSDVTASSWKDDPNADLYVVKIWYEVDPGRDAIGPQAAEEIIQTVATSPQEAIEYAKRAWSGPIDRIEVVDINPEENNEDLPFEACDQITASDESMNMEGYEDPDFDEDFDEDDDWMSEDRPVEEILLDAEYDRGFLEIEDKVFNELGLYGDFSGVRFGSGPIWFFSDPDHENNADMWMGTTDDALVKMDYTEFASEVVSEVLENPKELWEAKFKDYMLSLLRENDVNASTDIQASDKKLSGCSFDFDLGKNYNAEYVENAIVDIFSDFGLDVTAVDFRAVEYPGDRLYSQAGVDFEWSGDIYDADAIEDALIEFCDDEGGNFFGIDFYSLEG